MAGIAGNGAQQRRSLPAAGDAIPRFAHAPVHVGLWHRLV